MKKCLYFSKTNIPCTEGTTFFRCIKCYNWAYGIPYRYNTCTCRFNICIAINLNPYSQCGGRFMNINSSNRLICFI